MYQQSILIIFIKKKFLIQILVVIFKIIYELNVTWYYNLLIKMLIYY
jgi:hypothetical protein